MNSNLRSYLNFIKNTSLEPKKVELTEFGGVYFASCYNTLSSDFLVESVASGASFTKELALLKALVEFSERILSKQSKDIFRDSIITRSDGFAAFPVISSKEHALLKCRENSFSEAVERYVWANWWDNSNIGHHRSQANNIVRSKIQFFLNSLMEKFCLESVESIAPLTSIDSTHKTVILLAKIKGEGYLTGGATGSIMDLDQIYFRSITELARHLLGYSRIKSHPNLPIKDMTFYEKRLFVFASGRNNEIVSKRINSFGSDSIKIPNLAYDLDVQHAYSKDVILYRCLFENQPVFMGGNVNRLCI